LTSRGCEPQESSQPDRQTNVKEGDPDTPSIGLFAGDSTTALVCASGGEVYRDRRAALWGKKKRERKKKKEEGGGGKLRRCDADYRRYIVKRRGSDVINRDCRIAIDYYG